eukprot:TRINITY_DN2196_c0_g1_i3.p1 TRINITY_DN2196_c0_g1~~TRINITY_DN2196_c0_g1_i3.p1  ORF type:complete len:327 (-),score=71.94 TRINITY_DN2196_c0_g1_i3:46-1026(-)
MSKGKEIYSFQAPWTIYAMNWSNMKNKKKTLAIGSYQDDFINKIQVIQLDENDDNFKCIGSIDHPYPPTKIMFTPNPTGEEDLMGTSGDFLRLWTVANDGTIKQKCVLDQNKKSEYCSPLTSFDWNETNPALMASASIDTTCTIWDIEKQIALTQLIAHDKEVFDVAFAKGVDNFASVGADGSIRMFDLRSLKHSTILYENRPRKPLLRVCWNKQDKNYLSTFSMDSKETVILDIRQPGRVAENLGGHSSYINSVCWAPHSSCHITSAGDDKKALIWDISSINKKPIKDPILCYKAQSEINQIVWSHADPNFLSICFGDKVEVLKI